MKSVEKLFAFSFFFSEVWKYNLIDVQQRFEMLLE